jgi:hypothetical protein
MKYTLHKDRAFTALKLIKKSRVKRVCRGCDKEIEIGSSCIFVYELLGCRYANDYFHDVDCVKKAISKFFNNIKATDDWLKNMIEKSLKK